MSKTYDERLNHTVGVIKDVCGEADARQIEGILNGKSKQQVKDLSETVSIGFKGSSDDAEVKRLRAVKRAYVLASSVLPGATAKQFSALTDNYFTVATDLRKLFPYRARPILGNFDGRLAWEYSCTPPANHTPGSYCYLVHGIQAPPSKVGGYTEFGGKSNPTEKAAYEATRKKFSDDPDTLFESRTAKDKKGTMVDYSLTVNFCSRYLRDPSVLQTIIVSTALIDHDHRATYYPFGFILKVPSCNIYSARGRDQAVKNRTDDILGEMQRVFNENNCGNILLSPKQVLDDTAQSQGKTGYNEVVVVGTSPEGKHVEVSGLFIKVDAAGHLWVDPASTTPYVTDQIADLVTALSNARTIPIVAILDTSGATAARPKKAKDYFPHIKGM